jgi:hypothetical protein
MSNPTIRGWVGAGEKSVSFSPVSGKTPIFVRASETVRMQIRAGLWTNDVKTHVMDPEVPVSMFETITLKDGSPAYRLDLTNETVLAQFLALCKQSRREKGAGVDTTAADAVASSHSWD